MANKIDREIMKVGNNYHDVQDSTFGIYGYYRPNGVCMYIGIDSNIDKAMRHKHHTSPSKIKEQAINSYIQSKAIKSITYNVLHICRDKEEMENLETMYILFYKALGQCKFNKVVSLNPEMSTKLIEGISVIGRN